jgi:hypothetical protein
MSGKLQSSERLGCGLFQSNILTLPSALRINESVSQHPLFHRFEALLPEPVSDALSVLQPSNQLTN